MVLHPRSGRRQAPEGLTPGMGLWLGIGGVLALTAAPAQARQELPSRLQAALAQLAPAPAVPATANPFDDEPPGEPQGLPQPEPQAGTEPPGEPASPVQAPAPRRRPLAVTPQPPAEPTPADPAAASAPGTGLDAAPASDAVPLELELTANQQGYDSQLQRFVATGSVMARLAGGRLLADRLEFEASTRTLLAVGNVRFQRGQQYLQGSRLRYALLEGVGEIDDVYGVIDLDSTKEDFDLEQAASTPLPPAEP
ncbi:DUF3769 domain-containing protein, partial [Cyanobium sp. N5-Cardenillas]|nr:DUF3769 domain-containing protein [Cyanobium sp. N5-Cardenillas]